jgi:glutamate-1-semialdehyde 2,1-aminomutase
VTGFRVAIGGAQELFGVKPDLCALGKIVGGGLPLAAIAGRKDLLELTVPGRPNDGQSVYLSGTLNGNPLSAAAGIACIDTMIEDDGPSKIRATGTKLAEGLLDNARRLSIPFQVIGHPSFSQPVFCESPIFDHTSYMVRNVPATRQFGIEMIRRGTNVIIGGKLWISTAHTDDDIESTCTTAFEAMRAVRDAKLIQ